MNRTFREFTILSILILLLNGCAVESAISPVTAWPNIAAGELLSLQPGCTWYYLSQIMKGGGEIYASPNLTHFLVRWAIKDGSGLQGVALVNTLETSSAYWQNLRGGVGNPSDVSALVDHAKNLGWSAVTVKDIGITSLASKVAMYAASSGEILVTGAALFLDDWMSFVTVGGDL